MLLKGRLRHSSCIQYEGISLSNANFGFYILFGGVRPNARFDIVGKLIVNFRFDSNEACLDCTNHFVLIEVVLIEVHLFLGIGEKHSIGLQPLSNKPTLVG